MAATATKLGVSFYRYIHDRVSGANQIPQLSSIIEERAKELNLSASWEPAYLYRDLLSRYGILTFGYWASSWNRVFRVRTIQSVIRLGGFVVVGLYFAVLVVVLAILIAQDRAQHNWWRIVIGPAVLVVQLAALSLFAWGLAVWDSKRAWIVRVSAWSILFVGLVPLVSFAFVLAPILIMALPALWPWHGVPGVRR